MSEQFIDRLASRIDDVGAPACVGLDPVLDRLPEEIRAEHWEPVAAIDAFCRGVIDGVREHAAAIKLQSACFERYGSKGVAALEHAAAHARDQGLLVILDAKRGDIGISARHYAASAVHLAADAITVNAYLGTETVEPYLEAGLGVFVLVRTSNPGSDEIQLPKVEGVGTVGELMATRVAALGESHLGTRGLSNVGAVVGATKSDEGAALRARMPDAPFLVPGYGAQGGGVDDVRPLVRPGATTPSQLGVLVTASRSVIYPDASGGAWHDGVRAAATSFNSELRALI